MGELDRIIDNIHDPEGDMATDGFRADCHDLFVAIDYVRGLLGVAPYNPDQKIILVNEAHYASLLHKDHNRHDGTPYFRHLLGTVLNMVLDQSVTGLESLLSGFKHDDVEDKGSTKANLMRIDTYSDQLQIYTPDQMKAVTEMVWRNVDGVTKIKKATRTETKEATFRKMLGAILHWSVRVAYIKLADRGHNMDTLEGHGDTDEAKKKQMDIAEETEDIYVALAHLLKTHVSEARLIEGCLAIRQPDLIRDYIVALAQRNSVYLDKYKDKIYGQWKGDDKRPAIGDMNIVSDGLGQLLQRSNMHKPFGALGVADFNLDDRDPLFDIVVIVDDSTNINEAIGRVISKFSSVANMNLTVDTLKNNRGVLVRLFNKAFGGRLTFRINDRRAETRAKRGILAADSESQALTQLRRDIGYVLKTAGPQQNSMAVAREELLRRRIVCYTPDNVPHELPRGATVLDFARQVHAAVLLGARTATIADDVMGTNTRPICLFEELPHGVMVRINPPTQGESRIPAFMVHPSWLLFAGSSAKEVLKRHLATLSDVDVLGEQYFTMFCTIFRLDDQVKVALLDEVKVKGSKFESLPYDEIGKGSCDLVKLYVDDRLQRCNKWYVEVNLPNQEKELARLHQYFGKGINIETQRVGAVGDTGISRVEFEITLDTKALPVQEFVKTIIKLKLLGYDLFSIPIASEIAP